MLGWFSKAKKAPRSDESIEDKIFEGENARIQGSYTDHNQSPYQLRQSLEPMHSDELEAFEWVMNKMDKISPESSYADLIQDAMDVGWFYVDDQGMLRVSKEEP